MHLWPLWVNWTSTSRVGIARNVVDILPLGLFGLSTLEATASLVRLRLPREPQLLRWLCSSCGVALAADLSTAAVAFLIRWERLDIASSCRRVVFCFESGFRLAPEHQKTKATLLRCTIDAIRLPAQQILHSCDTYLTFFFSRNRNLRSW